MLYGTGTFTKPFPLWISNPFFTFHVGVNILWSIWVSFRRVQCMYFWVRRLFPLIQYYLAKLNQNISPTYKNFPENFRGNFPYQKGYPFWVAQIGRVFFRSLPATPPESSRGFAEFPAAAAAQAPKPPFGESYEADGFIHSAWHGFWG